MSDNKDNKTEEKKPKNIIDAIHKDDAKQQAKEEQERFSEYFGLNLDEFANIIRVDFMDSEAWEKRLALEKITKWLLANYPIATIKDDKNPMVLFYDSLSGTYKENGKCHIQELVYKILKDNYNTNRFNLVLDLVKAQTFITEEEFFDVENPGMLCLRNCVFDVRKKEKHFFSPTFRFTSNINVFYDPDADCPKFKQFLRQVVEEENIKLIQELFGHILYKSYDIPKLFLFNGSGRNGKGVLVNVIEKLLGSQNYIGLTIQQLEHPFLAGELYNKLACVGGDVPSTKLKDTSRLKTLTGNEDFTADRKFKGSITFKNYATFVFNCNEIPQTPDMTAAFFSRFIIIDFPHKFYPKKEVENMTEEKKKEYRVADPNIIDKITTEKELAGIFNWALEGLERMYEQGGFSYSESISDVKKTYLRKSDSLACFLEDCCDLGAQDDETAKDWMDVYYEQYCKAFNLPSTTKQALAKRFKNEFRIYSERKTVDSKRTMVWTGVAVNVEKFNKCMEEAGRAAIANSEIAKVKSNPDELKKDRLWSPTHPREFFGASQQWSIEEFVDAHKLDKTTLEYNDRVQQIENYVKKLVQSGDVFEHKPNVYIVL